MRYQLSTLLLLLFVGLTACGGAPEQVKLDRRFLSESVFQEQLAAIKAGVSGEVLDDYVWVNGEDKVFTLLTREFDATDNFGGLFLRHYRVGLQTPELLWTYQDSISCLGAVAGANLVKNQSPELRPAAWLGDEQNQFILRYTLGCTPETSSEEHRVLVLVNAQSGTPDVRLEAGLAPDVILEQLPASVAAKLRGLWGERTL